MVRDWELIRKILIALEEKKESHTYIASKSFADVDADVAGYHIALLIDAGLVEGTVMRTTNGTIAHASNLTWAGHEFLDKTRNDTVWNTVKTMAKDKGLSLSFDIIKGIATKVIEGLLGG